MPRSHRQLVRELELSTNGMPALLHACRRQSNALIDVDWSADRDHRVEALDILVAHPNAAMAHGLADSLRLVGSVNRVAIAHLQATSSQYSEIATGGGAERRNDDVATADDLAAFFTAPQRDCPPITIALDDFSVPDGDHTVSGWNRLPGAELDDAESALVRQLDEMPVRWDPCGILFLGLNSSLAA